MHTQLQTVAAAVQHATAALSPSNLYDFSRWGWAPGLTELQQSVALAAGRPGQQPAAAAAHAARSQPTPLAHLMARCPAAQAPHTAHALLSSLTRGQCLVDTHASLRASCVHYTPAEPQLDLARTAIKEKINVSWSREALKQGVVYAKAGEL